METKKNKNIYKIAGLLIIIAIPFLWFNFVPQSWLLGPLIVLSDEKISQFDAYMNLITSLMPLGWFIAMYIYIKKM
ncbi:MAG: hypothetical protein WCT42_04135 [Candidatus Paceibacterota bacterium]|jgi:hypothetical protein